MIMIRMIIVQMVTMMITMMILMMGMMMVMINYGIEAQFFLLNNQLTLSGNYAVVYIHESSSAIFTDYDSSYIYTHWA